MLFAANALYGYVRISAPPDRDIRVALIDSDDAFGPTQHEDRARALADIDAYVAQIGKLRGAHVNLIVLPENIAMLAPAWRDGVQAKLAAAANGVDATLVAGFNTNLDGAQRNVCREGMARGFKIRDRSVVPWRSVAMSLRVVGAGCGRTGTASLKLGLERLLGAPCYHMIEVFQHPEHVSAWHKAMRGEEVDWNRLFAGYIAAVDWPAGACWPELMRAYPDALVLLSIRDPEAWWVSANETIFAGLESNPVAPPGGLDMVRDMMQNRFGADITSREACIAAFNAHNARVRATVPKERLLVWQAQEGWAPICKALDLEIPAEPFPRLNTTEEWRARSAARAEQARAEPGTVA